ncbi:polyprenol reductase-like [Limulus polyphemus]|uniref:Polyprenal reductase n=1 Tax=Limulus polyphemus TaxID=6850 RepID=A0ABM1C1M8_LIMPO|nr:polyprenol reductase-like [Limulus polyphemus]
MNYITIIWLLSTFILSFTGILVLYFPIHVPQILRSFFKYGKAAEPYEKYYHFLRVLELPKSWFVHFYIFASILYSFVTWMICSVYFQKKQVPSFVLDLLHIFAGPNQRASASPEAVVLVESLLLLHIYQRLYECVNVNVFSAGKINILHYCVGHGFYVGVALTILEEAPGFSLNETRELTHYSWSSVKWYQAFGVLLGLWGIYLQHSSHVILASLRKNSKGSVVTYHHQLPSGGWFDWVSCPHYFAEIVIYMAMNLILGGHHGNWWLVCLWVICNQVLAAIMSHHWYKSNFKEYPKTRRAIVPFIL